VSEGGPFRELFVEVPMAILEAAVRETEQRSTREAAATWRPSKVSLLLNAFSEGPAHRAVCLRYGWDRFVISRMAAFDGIEIRARLECGHVLALPPIGERVLYAAATPTGMAGALLDAIDKRLLEGPSCFCVRRSPA
jgi:hypothetical protein